MRYTIVVALVVAAGCGGSVQATEEAATHSADAFVECLRDDDGVLIAEDGVLEVREGFSVDDPERDESFRLDREARPEIRGDFTIVRWYSDEDELSKVQVYFTRSDDDAARLRAEHVENARAGGAPAARLEDALQRRRNVFLAWDQGGTDEMRGQIDDCLS